MNTLQQLSLGILFCTLGQPAFAIQKRAPSSTDSTEQASDETSSTSRIAWYTSLDEARADAARLNLPILVQSAAPQCRSVPGMW